MTRRLGPEAGSDPEALSAWDFRLSYTAGSKLFLDVNFQGVRDENPTSAGHLVPKGNDFLTRIRQQGVDHVRISQHRRHKPDLGRWVVGFSPPPGFTHKERFVHLSLIQGV